MRWILASVVLLLAGTGELAAHKGKGIRFWNLTTATISGFQLSPAGKDAWGPNQTLNDKDKEVDHDERLRITGVEPGRYDAKVSYRDSEAMPREGYRDQGGCGVLDCGQGFEGLQQVILSRARHRGQPAGVAPPLSALSLACGYSQRHLTAVHFGCSPTHCAI